MAKTLMWKQENQGLIPFTNINYLEYVHLYIYLYMCVNV